MTYRPHIDGLRALAVLAVIAFHFAPAALSGGFLGVDIFFVISGFVITNLLCVPSNLDWRLRVREFYLRRARRLLPALLLTSFAVAGAALVIYLPEDLIRLGRYLFFTPIMLANYASALDGGYFEVDAPSMPLRHFWSLAVEEQFYLAYALAIPALFVPGASKRRAWVLATVAALSMALCIRGELRGSPTTFYLMPARAWELMFGALAALFPLRWAAGKFAIEVAAYACIAIVLASFALLDDRTGFPHLWVAIPCAATALLLVIGEEHSAGVLRMLSREPLVFTGKISYSLYLWHFPVLAFLQYYAIRALSASELLEAWALVYAIAILSWRFIENPFRQRRVLKSDFAFVMTALVSCIALGAIGAWLRNGDGLPSRFPRDIQELTRLDPVPPGGRCMSLPLDQVAAGNLCRFGPSHPGIRKAVLWGDSHARVLLPAFEALARANDVEIEFAGRPSCRPVLGADRYLSVTRQTDCAAFNDAMISAVRRIRPAVTILGAYWGVEAGYAAEAVARKPVNGPSGQEPWQDLVRLSREAGSGVCVVLDVPHLPNLVPYALAMARRRGLDTSFIYVSSAEALRQYEHFEGPVRGLAAAGELEVVDPKNLLCSGSLCEVELDGRSLYRDSNHLSRAGVMAVQSSLEGCLR